MAASMSPQEHARILLEFTSPVKKNAWFFIVYSELPTISDVCQEIVRRHNLDSDVTLHLRDAWLPQWEKTFILKDEDCIAVRPASHTETYANESPGTSTSIVATSRESKKKKKRKHIDSDDAALESPDSSLKVKKKKKEKIATKDSDTSTQCLSVTNIAATQQHTSVHKQDKKAKWEESHATDATDVAASKKGKEAQICAREAAVTATGDDSNETHLNISLTESVDTSISNIEDSRCEETLKKKKRIRKHRKRKKAGSDLNSSTCSENLNKSTEPLNKYEGKAIQKNELFFGSIPDKLVTPKYYRHGYRNLNVYKPEPNKHQVFKSDSEEENEVQQNTKQYNFLSSTRILDERDQYRDGTDPSETCFQPNIVANEKDQQTIPANNTSENVICREVVQNGVTDFIQTRDDNMNKEKAEEQNLLIASPINQVSSTENASYHYGQPSVGNDTTSLPMDICDTAGSESESGAPPSVLARKTLANGVSVFVRPRRHRHTNAPSRELTKDEQLNTEATNFSTIFKVPPVPKMVSPRFSSSPRCNQSDVKAEMTSPNISQSPGRTQNAQAGRSHDQNGSASKSPVSTSTPQSAIQSKLIDLSQSAEMEDTPACADSPSSMKQVATKPVTNGNGPVPTQPTDYTKCPQMKGIPEVGWIIAYRVLEISLSCTPEVSAYKEAEVLAVDDKDMLTLKLLSAPEGSFNKFHVELEDDDSILTNTQTHQEQVTLHMSSLLEARVVRR